MLQASQRRGAEGWRRQCADAFSILHHLIFDSRHSCQGLPQASLELRSSRSWSIGAVLMFRELDTLRVSFSRCGEELGVNALAPVLRRTVRRCFRHPASPRHSCFSEVPEEPSSCCLWQQI